MPTDLKHPVTDWSGKFTEEDLDEIRDDAFLASDPYGVSKTPTAVLVDGALGPDRRQLALHVVAEVGVFVDRLLVLVVLHRVADLVHVQAELLRDGLEVCAHHHLDEAVEIDVVAPTEFTLSL